MYFYQHLGTLMCSTTYNITQYKRKYFQTLFINYTLSTYSTIFMVGGRATF